jgi:hypothetical protein
MKIIYSLLPYGISALSLFSCSGSTSPGTVSQKNDVLDFFLRQWGAAVVLSDSTAAPDPLKYNNGESAETYNVNGINYNLGPINLYNYKYDKITPVYYGPYFYASLMSSSLEPSSVYVFTDDDISLSSIPGKKEVTEENEKNMRLPLALRNFNEYYCKSTVNSDVQPNTVDTYTFFDYNGNTINAFFVATGTVSSGGRTITVNVYADKPWYSEANAPASCTAILQKFIGSGNNDSIYEWVSNIFGAEWGTSLYSEQISDDKTISILMFDIDGDGYNGSNGVFTVGYFYSRDNFKKTYYSFSNEKIMFSIDLPYMLKTASGETWSPSSSYPNKIYGTLAHEFQHMIHYYQKSVVNGSYSSTWLNEMCSVCTEDFIADKLGIEGPRGIIDVNSSGSQYIASGRLPLFNYRNDDSLTIWGGNLADYSNVFGFGSYLARNFGGPDLFRKIVNTSKVDFDAIKESVPSYTFLTENSGSTWNISGTDEVCYIGSSSVTITPISGGSTLYFIASNTDTSSSKKLTIQGGSLLKSVTVAAGSNTYFKTDKIINPETFFFTLESGVVVTAVAR